MTDSVSVRPRTTRYPATDAEFAASVEASFASIGNQKVSDVEVLAAVQALLRVSYPLATVKGDDLGSSDRPMWHVFRDDRIRDAEMITRTSSGDVTAFEELYDRHSPYAFGLARRITNDQPAAEEAVQDAFLNVWRSASAFDPARASVKTWILTITHHRAIDAVRRRRGPTIDIESAAAASLVDAGMRTPDVWPEVSARLDSAAVRSAMASLPASQQTAIKLAYFRGFTQAEIAAQIGIPLGTVKSQVRLGLSRLRALLAEGSATLNPE